MIENVALFIGDINCHIKGCNFGIDDYIGTEDGALINFFFCCFFFSFENVWCNKLCMNLLHTEAETLPSILVFEIVMITDVNVYRMNLLCLASRSI